MDRGALNSLLNLVEIDSRQGYYGARELGLNIFYAGILKQGW